MGLALCALPGNIVPPFSSLRTEKQTERRLAIEKADSKRNLNTLEKLLCKSCDE